MKLFKVNYCSLFIGMSLLIILILFPAQCSEGIKSGLRNSCEIIIPSLFPYIVLSSFLIRSGADEIKGKILSPAAKHLFYLPECAGTAVFMSFIGGFPIGAKCVELLYKKKSIDTETAQRMMDFCVCSGPAFMITAVGAVMLNNITAGIILYLSQILSGIIIGIISGMTERLRKKKIINKYADNNKQINGSIISCLIESASDAAYSIISMTSLILIFSLIENLIRSSGIYDILSDISGAAGEKISALITIFLEVTKGCCAVKEASLPLWYFSLCVGFGGICVHFQIFEILKNIQINRKRYLIFRFLNALLSASITFLICTFYNPVSETFAAKAGERIYLSESTYTGSAALIIMSVIFVLSMRLPPFSANLRRAEKSKALLKQ